MGVKEWQKLGEGFSGEGKKTRFGRRAEEAVNSLQTANANSLQTEYRLESNTPSQGSYTHSLVAFYMQVSGKSGKSDSMYKKWKKVISLALFTVADSSFKQGVNPVTGDP